jgi:hypothetical protein
MDGILGDKRVVLNVCTCIFDEVAWVIYNMEKQGGNRKLKDN